MKGTMSSSSDVKMRNMLDNITSTLQNGDDIDQLAAQSGAAHSEIEDVVDIIQSLHSSLTPRQPREQYAADLRTDLLGGRRGMVDRVSRIPARVHIAAILAVFCRLRSANDAPPFWLGHSAGDPGRSGSDSALSCSI